MPEQCILLSRDAFSTVVTRQQGSTATLLPVALLAVWLLPPAAVVAAHPAPYGASIVRRAPRRSGCGVSVRVVRIIITWNCFHSRLYAYLMGQPSSFRHVVMKDVAGRTTDYFFPSLGRFTTKLAG